MQVLLSPYYYLLWPRSNAQILRQNLGTFLKFLLWFLSPTIKENFLTISQKDLTLCDRDKVKIRLSIRFPSVASVGHAKNFYLPAFSLILEGKKEGTNGFLAERLGQR